MWETLFKAGFLNGWFRVLVCSHKVSHVVCLRRKLTLKQTQTPVENSWWLSAVPMIHSVLCLIWTSLLTKIETSVQYRQSQLRLGSRISKTSFHDVTWSMVKSVHSKLLADPILELNWLGWNSNYCASHSKWAYNSSFRVNLNEWWRWPYSRTHRSFVYKQR